MLWLSTQLCVWLWAVVTLVPIITMADDMTGTTEIDVIFPRNGTFAPMPLMPVVFAIRNQPVASLLHPQISYTIHKLDPSGNVTYKPTDDYDVRLSSSDSPYLWYKGEPNRFLEPGRWVLQWGFRYDNCSKTDDPKYQEKAYGPWPIERVYRGFHVKTTRVASVVIFTIEQGAEAPDLRTLSGPDRCNDADAQAYSVDEVLDIPSELDMADATKCGKFPEGPPPTPSPCLVTVDAEAAASISAAITSTECGSATPAVSCPIEEDGVGGRPSVGYSLCSAVLSGWLLFGLLRG